MNAYKVYRIIMAAVCVLLAALLCAAAVSVYVEGSARKAENSMESIYTPEIAAEKLGRIAPVFCVFAGLLLAGLLPQFREKKGEKPVPAAKRDRGGLPAERTADIPGNRTGEKRRKTLQTVIVVTAVVFLIAGILNGSAMDVLIKAITICTECIGLG